MKRDPSRRRLPLALWPEADRKAWEAIVRAPAWNRPEAAVRWSDVACERIAGGYGRWLTFLSRTGRMGDPDPAARVTRQTVAEFVELLRTQVRPITIVSCLRTLIDVLKVLAPEYDSAWILRIQTSLRQMVEPDPYKRMRVRDIRDLWDLGIQLMGRAVQSGRTGRIFEAIDYRDGLIIALLAAVPLRLRNLSGIVIGQHLTQVGGKWGLLFHATETKQRRILEFRLPPELSPYLARYLEVYRPRFGYLGQTPYLWIGRNGEAMAQHTIGDLIARRTKAAFGIPINAHLFRTCAATSLAQRDPEHVYAGAPLLGHATLDMTYKHYILATGISAVRQYQNALAEWLPDTPGNRPTTK